VSHTCTPPRDRQGANVWRCPRCEARFIWSKRMIGREMREGWTRATETLADRHRRNVAEMDRQFRPWLLSAAAVAVVVTIAAVALIVWIVLRVTS
jgi:uncharacterized C2H2 Zn-finger protein